MKPALLHTTKYDGSLHYRFPVELVHDSGELVAVYRSPDVDLHSYRGMFRGDHHMLGLYWLDDRHHNVCLMWNRDWTPRHCYVNIATPVTWDGHRVHYDDLDLDLILKHGSTDPHLDDEDEFAAHQQEWSYSDELVARCWREVAHVRKLMKQRIWPFVDELFEWRPPNPTF